MTTNIVNRLKDPAIALKDPLCLVAKSSPRSKNGIQPNPKENPIMKTMRLISGKYLQSHILTLQFCTTSKLIIKIKTIKIKNIIAKDFHEEKSKNSKIKKASSPPSCGLETFAVYHLPSRQH